MKQLKYYGKSFYVEDLILIKPIFTSFSYLCNIATRCPSSFPNLETHDDNNQHGDVCRNDQIDGFNVGWICPNECQPTEDKNAPFCQMSNSNNAPCRAREGEFLNFITLQKPGF